ncbi:hypothetical protein SDC9_151037 [bioreactor metagenome]|uniref:Uncharacterized protein n=1 Tax=bioreactor metagenome TaxID=1076179 RepID=A0A645ETF1_9ZZZZ
MDADPADVVGVAVGQVEPAEDQALVLGLEDCQPLGRLVGEDVPLVDAGRILLPEVVTAIAGVVRGPGPGGPLGALGGDGQAFVDLVHMGLFDGELAGQVRRDVMRSQERFVLTGSDSQVYPDALSARRNGPVKGNPRPLVRLSERP